MIDYTQEQSKHRAALKRALQIAKCPFENEDTTERLEDLCIFCNLKVVA